MRDRKPLAGSAQPDAGRADIRSHATDAGASAPHVHAWVGVAFSMEGDRPLFRQACACGADRAIRAWERYWDPAEGPTTDSAVTGIPSGQLRRPSGPAR